uniref:Uncharacterized protein n=1 Tax=Aegilops tauschii subsp. strangulata TaxID=200361 RepID=A0A453ISW4_AEGTS
ATIEYTFFYMGKKFYFKLRELHSKDRRSLIHSGPRCMHTVVVHLI